jgi:MFS family permease
MSIYFIFALTLLNGASVQAARVVLALYALDLGAQPFTVGILAATFSMFPVLLAVKVGKLADRFGSLWMLVCGAAAGGLGMLMPYLFPGISTVFVAAVMNGLSAVLFNLLMQNLVGILSESGDRPRNFSNYSLMNAICNFIGPLFAGFTIEHSGHAYACLYLAIFSLAPLAMLAIWGRRLPGGNHHANSNGGGVRGILSAPGVRRTLVTGSLQNTGDSLYQFYMPVYTHAMGLSASAIGIVLAMYPAAAFAMRLVLSRLIVRFKEDRLLAYAFYIGAVSLIAVPFFRSAAMLASISFVFGLGMGCCGPIVTMLMFDNAPMGRSGEALGLKMTVNHLTKVVTPIAFGSVASAFGISPVFWINALMLGAGGFLSYPKMKN